MATSLGGWFDKVFFDAHGEPCAGGSLRFYQTGTDIPQGVATFDGTPLGAVIRLDDDGRPESDFRFYTDKIYRVVVVDADGVVVKQIDGVAIPESDGGAMYNPMTAPGDLIVGGVDGDPLRLALGADGDILATALSGGILSPKWESGPKKYRNVYSNVPSPNINDGYLGGLFYMTGGGAQTIDLPSAASIPSKSFIDFVFLDDTTTLTITPQGGSVLNTQATAVTVGGKSATLYRLTFLGRGDIGGVPTDQWAVGGSVLPDGKVKVDGSDTSPDYLAAKLAAGTGISLTNTGSAVEIAATAQTGDHQLLVSATDAAAGYLGAKLTAGSNITLTPQTDGDGVQTLEISATGGGGGGSVESAICAFPFMLCTSYKTNSNVSNAMVFIASRGGTPKYAQIYSIWNSGFSATIAAKLYTLDADGSNWVKSWECPPTSFTATYPGKQCIQICKLPLTQTGSASVLEIGKQYMIAFSIASGAQNLYIPSYTNSWGQTAWVAKHLANTNMPDTWGFITNATTEFWASDVIVE